MQERGKQMSLLPIVPPEVLSVGEIWDQATPELLSKLREDRRIERKPAGIHARDLAQYFSMWANTTDGGLIVVGMENDGIISGCVASGDAHMNSLDSHARDCCPDAKLEVKRMSAVNRNGKPDYLLLFRVHFRANKLVRDVSGNAYIRYGESKHKLRADAQREIEIDRGQVDVEYEPCSAFEFPRHFRMDLVNEFAENARVRCSYPAEYTALEILELRRLVTRPEGKFIPNTACVLLFARDPLTQFPGCKIRFFRHEGEAEGTGAQWNAVKDVVIEGPIPSLIMTADSLLTSQLREFSRLGSDGKFYTASEYPKEAWIEAIVNACVHRSYGPLRHMNIFVRMFDDRLEVESPGGFPPPVTPATIYEIHAPRNPLIMDALMYLNYVKCAREGARRMRDSMGRADLPPPIFKQPDGDYPVVKVTLRNNLKQRKVWVDSDVVKIIGADLAKSLNAEELRAVNFISEYERAHVAEIAKHLKKNWRTAQRLLMALSSRGILRHVHRRDLLRDPNAHFVINELAKPRKR